MCLSLPVFLLFFLFYIISGLGCPGHPNIRSLWSKEKKFTLHGPNKFYARLTAPPLLPWKPSLPSLTDIISEYKEKTPAMLQEQFKARSLTSRCMEEGKEMREGSVGDTNESGGKKAPSVLRQATCRDTGGREGEVVMEVVLIFPCRKISSLARMS